jgi:hypothetical protein
MVCIKDEYLIKVSFLKYSGLLDYLKLYYRISGVLLSSGVYRLEDCRLGSHFVKYPKS